MANKNPPKQNPSGHISMDVSLSAFYRENNLKEHKIAKLHEAGVLGQHRGRNPINAEKSPRADFHGFDFNPPPPKVTEKTRWHYPESDWGLMAKFSSQKPIYEAIYARERSQKQIEQEISQLRAKNLQIIEKELKKQQDNIERERNERHQRDREFEQMEERRTNPQKFAPLPSGSASNYNSSAQQFQFDESLLEELQAKPHHHHSSEPATPPTKKFNPEKLNMQESSLFNKYGKSSQNQELLDQALTCAIPAHVSKIPSKKSLSSIAIPSSSSSSKDLQLLQKRTKRNLEAYEKNLLSHFQSLTAIPVANIRALQEKHPEVLAKYRTERAAEFVAKRGSAAIEPPPRREDLGSVAFRPGGILPAPSAKLQQQQLEKTSKGARKTLPEAKAISLPVDLLEAQLKKTEEDIAYQTVKIGLHRQPPKSYEKTKSRRSRDHY